MGGSSGVSRGPRRVVVACGRTSSAGEAVDRPWFESNRSGDGDAGAPVGRSHPSRKSLARAYNGNTKNDIRQCNYYIADYPNTHQSFRKEQVVDTDLLIPSQIIG